MRKYIYRFAYLLAITLLTASCNTCNKGNKTSHHKQKESEQAISKVFKEWEEQRKGLLEKLKALYVPDNPLSPEDTFENKFLDETKTKGKNLKKWMLLLERHNRLYGERYLTIYKNKLRKQKST